MQITFDEAKDALNQSKHGVSLTEAEKLEWDDAYVAAIWPHHQFYLTLDQSLITAMEDEARWMIANKLTTEKQVPNFLDYIYTDGLKAIKPGAVRIAGK